MSEKFKFKNSKVKKRRFFNLVDETQIINTGHSHIELFSNKQMVIEGCRSVCEYNNDYLKLKLFKGYIEINGKQLDIFLYEDNSITVNGEILNILFCV